MFFAAGLDNRCFSGQTAQLVILSAARFLFTHDIIRVEQQK